MGAVSPAGQRRVFKYSWLVICFDFACIEEFNHLGHPAGAAFRKFWYCWAGVAREIRGPQMAVAQTTAFQVDQPTDTAPHCELSPAKPRCTLAAVCLVSWRFIWWTWVPTWWLIVIVLPASGATIQKIARRVDINWKSPKMDQKVLQKWSQNAPPNQLRFLKAQI